MVLTKMLCGTVGCSADSKSNATAGLNSSLATYVNEDFEDSGDSSLEEGDLENIEPEVVSGRPRKKQGLY